MATKQKGSKSKAQNKGKTNTTKNENHKKDMGVLESTGKALKKISDTLSGKGKTVSKETKPVEKIESNELPPVTAPVVNNNEPQAILPEGETGTVTNENEAISSTTSNEGIEPIEGTDTNKPVEKVKKEKSKYFSDEVIEMKSPYTFLNAIMADAGLKIHRVEKEKYILSQMEPDEVTGELKQKEFIFPDNLEAEDKALLPADWFDIFQKEIDAYKVHQKGLDKAEKLKPKPKAGVDAPPSLNPVTTPIVYAESGVDDMKAYGEQMYQRYITSVVVTKRNDKHLVMDVEKNLKTETTLYKFELKFDQVNRGWYIDISRGNLYVRIPNDKSKFLPIK